MVSAACERPCIEMGSRRTHEEAAVAAARAAYLVGFAPTSNLEAGRRYGVPTAGTTAHAFTLLHDDESGGLPQPGGRPGHRDDAAGRHLRRRAGHPDGGRGRRPGARRDPARLRRPAASWPHARELLDELGATRPGSSSPATSTSTPSPRWPPRRSTPTASAPRWSPARARRRSAWSTSWSSGTASRSPRSERTKASVGGRKFAVRRHEPTGSRPPRWSAADADRDPRRRPRPRRPPGRGGERSIRPGRALEPGAGAPRPRAAGAAAGGLGTLPRRARAGHSEAEGAAR